MENHSFFGKFLPRVLARTSLRFQFLTVLFVTLGATFAFSYWVNTRVQARALEEVRAYVESTSRAVQVSVNQVRNPISGLEILTIETDAPNIRLTLRDPSGRILAQSSGANDDTNRSGMSYRIPIREAGRLAGYLDVDLATTGLTDIFRQLIWSQAALWSAIFVLGGLLLVPVANAIGRSHRQIEVFAASVAGGNLDPSFPEPTSREAAGLFASFRTLLARLRQEREIEQRLVRAEREASIGRMTSGVAHDIRNPLNYVELALGELWRKRSSAGPVDSGEEALYDGIREELHRVGEITSDLLAFGRPVIPQLREENAGALLHECVAALERRSPERVPDINVEADEGLVVVTDGDLIQRVLTNVIDNALDATEPGEAVSIGCAADDGNGLLWIEDAGSGLPPELIDHMFEPYITSKPSGTGLGLALAHQWVSDMNGTIEVRNRTGGGTRVEIRLPLGKGESVEPGL